MCPEEISAGNAYRSSGSLTLALELASGICSDAHYLTRNTCEDGGAGNVWTPTIATGEKIANDTSDDTTPATSRNSRFVEIAHATGFHNRLWKRNGLRAAEVGQLFLDILGAFG